MRSFAFDWVGAEADIKQALALDPTDPDVIVSYGRLLEGLGRLTEALATWRKSLARRQDRCLSGRDTKRFGRGRETLHLWDPAGLYFRAGEFA